MTLQDYQPLAQNIATTILRGFNRHFEIFQSITAGALERFEKADWQQVQLASRERIVFYDHRVEETIGLIRENYGIHDLDKELWKTIKVCYMRLLSNHRQPELAETFYTSVFCHQFPREYYTNDFIFMNNGMSTLYIQGDVPSYRCYYPNTDGLKNSIRQIIKDAGFTLPFENLDRDIRNIYKRIVKLFPTKKSRETELNFQFQVIRHPFFRNKGAYIVGRMLNDRNETGFALAILNNEQGGLYIDALVFGEKELSLVFSYSQAYFMVEHQVPSAIVKFLQSVLPDTSRSELYSAIGLHKQGKSVFYRDFLHHLRHSSDKLVIAPGIRGMVMMVFTLPSYSYVFKIIKDKFAPQKEFTRQVVAEKYQLVKRHDRVGRMADMLEYSDVSMPKSRFDPALLQELYDTCGSSLTETEEGYIVFKHMYIERRMIPLNIYLEKATDDELDHLIKGYGNAIKQLAGANIFPGDFLYKNFGVTPLGKVVFYDYDEISYMTECNFRQIPPPRFPEDEFSSEPWYSIAPNDVFPEEFGTFLLTNPKIRKIFLKYHKDLLDYRYWQKKQENIRQGKFEDVFPYPTNIRFKR
ncbi:MAG: bifunctional isocitrate dehydrogenase kinase/phosphatase [Pseudomonadota bacterium]|jgi:isocitrate dehydrogenase kinase/phosphatase